MIILFQMYKILYCLYKAIVRTIDQDGIEHAGYMTFMILLSIFPFFVFILAFTGFVGASELGANFIQLTLENMPPNVVDSIRARIKELGSSPPQSLLTLAIAGSIWTASSFVECLRTILNRVYEIKSPPHYLFRRMLSIVQFLIISLLISLAMLILVISPIIIAKVPALNNIIDGYMIELNFTRYILVFISLFSACFSLYYIIPNVRLRFAEVIPGALLSVILWIGGGYLLSDYIGYYNQINIVYGSIGSIIVTLIFFFLINLIFIYGAEFNFLMKKYYD